MNEYQKAEFDRILTAFSNFRDCMKVMARTAEELAANTANNKEPGVL